MRKLFLLSAFIISACASQTQTDRSIASVDAPETLPELTADQKKMVKTVINSYADTFAAMDEYYDAKKKGPFNLGLTDSDFFEKIKPLVKECHGTDEGPEADEYLKSGDRTFKASIKAENGCPISLSTSLRVITHKVPGMNQGNFKATGSGKFLITDEKLKSMVDVYSTTLKGTANTKHEGLKAVGNASLDGEILSKSAGKIEISSDLSALITHLKEDPDARKNVSKDYNLKQLDGISTWANHRAGLASATLKLNFKEKGFIAELRVVAHPVEASNKDNKDHSKEWRYFVNRKEVSREEMLGYLEPRHANQADAGWPASSTSDSLKHGLNPWINLSE